MNSKYSLNHLIKITVRDFTEDQIFGSNWQPARTSFFGLKKHPAGMYGFLSGDLITTEVPENHVVKDDKLLEKPRVVLYFQDGHKLVKHFDTYEEAKKHAMKVQSKCKSRWTE